METQVAFTSGDEQIFGVLHLPERRPAAAVIMCHGFTGSKSEAHRLFVKAARDFASHGLAALRFDFRGSGDSAGDFRDMTVTREIEDAGAALDHLASRPEVDASRLGVLGLSLGGCVAACLAGREARVACQARVACRARISALVLWAAVAHPGRMAARLGPAFGTGEVLDMDGWGLGKGFIEDVPHIRPLAEVARYAGPSLVVHGGSDETVPPSDATDYRMALGGRCRVHLVEGAGHVFGGLGYEAEAIEVSREFLVEALRAGGAPA